MEILPSFVAAPVQKMRLVRSALHGHLRTFPQLLATLLSNDNVLLDRAARPVPARVRSLDAPILFSGPARPTAQLRDYIRTLQRHGLMRPHMPVARAVKFPLELPDPELFDGRARRRTRMLYRSV